MQKISFTEKNDFVLKHKAAKYFSLDLDLFRRKFLTHKLNTDLSRANVYTYERLDGQMLYSLLEACTPEEIIANRTGIPVPADEIKSDPPPAPSGASPSDAAPSDAAPSDASPPAPVHLMPPTPFEELKRRIDELEQSKEVDRDEIDDLRSLLEDRDASLESLAAAVAELEKKAFHKKKASGKSSP
jgi:hypothetical protein